MLATDQLIKHNNLSKFENSRAQSTCQEKPILRPNYMRYVHDCGVRKGDNVLVVGQICDAALEALAKRVGKNAPVKRRSSAKTAPRSKAAKKSIRSKRN